jgi:uncharacterized repeat protein (TIGR01451 family)
MQRLAVRRGGRAGGRGLSALATLGTAVAVVAGILAAAAAPAGAAQSPLHLYVGYADGLRGSSPDFPSPWSDDANVTFVGGSESGSFDAGAIRIDNSSDSPVPIDSLTVQVGDTTFNGSDELWSELTVPPETDGEPGHLILTQTHDYDFDTSDVGPPGDCDSPNSILPLVQITIAGQTTTLTDRSQILNTGGVDGANCPPGANESHPWTGVTADLGVDVSSSPDHVSSGAQTQFQAVVTNNGPDDATGATLTEQLNGGSFVSSSLPQGCSLSTGQDLECDLGGIASGDSVTVNVLATAPAADFTDTASVSADQADFNQDNNSSSATTTICVDCTGGFVTNGGTLNGPPIDRKKVKQSGTITAPTGITGAVTSDNVGSDIVPNCPGFEQYGEVFLVVTPPSTPGNPFRFTLTLESNKDPSQGVPPQEPVGKIKVLRGCDPLPQCGKRADGTLFIPLAKKGKPPIHGCVIQVQRNNRSGNVDIKTLDDGFAGDPPIRGGG